jgi:hypothetical protein
MTRKPGLGGLLLLGAAAFGAYKYSKMSEQEKKNLKDKGKRMFDENLGGLKNMFGKRTGSSQTANTSAANGSTGFNQA